LQLPTDNVSGSSQGFLKCNSVPGPSSSIRFTACSVLASVTTTGTSIRSRLRVYAGSRAIRSAMPTSLALSEVGVDLVTVLAMLPC
jgi:hypothetical protein